MLNFIPVYSIIPRKLSESGVILLICGNYYLSSINFEPVTSVLSFTLLKKIIKFFLYIRKFRREQLQSHIWLTASSYMGKCLRISSYIRKPYLIYMTLQLLHSEFPYIWGKFYFLFYQCIMVKCDLRRDYGDYIWPVVKVAPDATGSY